MPHESTPATSRPGSRPEERGTRQPRFRYTARLAEEIERRWQARWMDEGTFVTPSPDEPGFQPRPKFYVMDMFPYPSGAGLHVGHPIGYIGTDIVARYRRMRGFNVLHPMGWDAFGLPAEQYAIQTGVHPAETTRKAIDTFRRQLQRFGFSYDWSREFATIDPAYYRWTQWIWLQAYHAWFDRDQKRARPIDELIEEFRSGERPITYDPSPNRASGMVLPGRPDETWESWDGIDPHTQRQILSTWRLTYLATMTVNWCPALGTVLADEEVIDGRSERGGFPVVRRPLKQWMFRITAYADRLLEDLDRLDWPESTRTMQREWIGRSEGAEISFPVVDRDEPLKVFSTRPDTIFGATYMVVAPEHPLVDEALANPAPETDEAALRAYVDAARNRADVERMAETKEKTGVFTGRHAINPATGERIPIWVADYVLMSYGHGAIMAVPSHDQRDGEFAKAFGLPTREVVRAPEDAGIEAGEAFTGDGVAINSANDEVSLDGLSTPEAKTRIIAWLESKGLGRGRVNYRLRDWLFSRQRYWGEPFPVVFDEHGDHHPVAEENLPVELPDLKDYQPVESDDPQPLLAKATGWVRTTAGEAGVSADELAPDAPVTRETNTMPGWAGSCWYYLRYCDPRAEGRFVDDRAERYWMAGEIDGTNVGRPESDAIGGVDLYIGGSEHAVLHLLYARFWHKILFDLGHVSTPEPFQKLFHQGLLTSFAYQRADRTLVPTDEVEEREDGTFVERATGEAVTQIIAKMSKSLRNVVNPDEVIAEYGADTFRLYEMYMGPLEASAPWNTRDVIGLFRFLQRTWRLIVDEETGEPRPVGETNEEVERALHRTIAKVGDDIERLAFNTAIAAMIEFVNAATSAGGVTRSQAERFARILSPFAPHAADEIAARLGGEGTLAHEPWPAFDEAMLREATIEIPVQIQGKVKATISIPADADEKAMEKAALADERVKRLVEGKTIRKVIAVKGRIVNIIAT